MVLPFNVPAPQPGRAARREPRIRRLPARTPVSLANGPEAGLYQIDAKNVKNS